MGALFYDSNNTEKFEFYYLEKKTVNMSIETSEDF